MGFRIRYIMAVAGLLTAMPAAQAQPAVNTPEPPDSLLVSTLRLLEPAPESSLTQRHRTKEYLNSIIGVLPALQSAAGAGFSQWLDSPTEWGQGASGYGRRVASRIGYNTIRNTISFASSIPLHEDNRYFASGKTGFWPRTRFALESPFMARRPDGRRSVSISGIAGIAGATLIAYSWAPPSWHGPEHIAESAAITIGVTAGLNFAREFVPDLIRRLQRKPAGPVPPTGN